MPPDPNAPWNPSNDPMDVFGKNRAWGGPPASASEPFQPVPNPLLNTDYSQYRNLRPAGEAVSVVAHAFAGDFIFNLIAVGVLSPLWVCLYPLAAFAGLVTFFYAYPFLANFLRLPSMVGSRLMLICIGAAATAVVLWSVSRFEHLLANNGAFRLGRHVIRLPLLGLATVFVLQRLEWSRVYISLPAILRILRNPQNLGIVIVVMIAAHFILWNWTWAREFWHRRLMGAQLRRRGT